MATATPGPLPSHPASSSQSPANRGRLPPGFSVSDAAFQRGARRGAPPSGVNKVPCPRLTYSFVEQRFRRAAGRAAFPLSLLGGRGEGGRNVRRSSRAVGNRKLGSPGTGAPAPSSPRCAARGGSPVGRQPSRSPAVTRPSEGAFGPRSRPLASPRPLLLPPERSKLVQLGHLIRSDLRGIVFLSFCFVLLALGFGCGEKTSGFSTGKTWHWRGIKTLFFFFRPLLPSRRKRARSVSRV